MRSKTRKAIGLFVLIVIVIGLMGLEGIFGTQVSAATLSPKCTGSANTGSSTAVVQTGGPLVASVGHVFDVRATVFNRTAHCHHFEATIVIGGGAWEFPNNSGPRKTTRTWFDSTDTTPGYYYTYTIRWEGWIKPNSHVNFYEPMEVATGTPKGMTQIIEIYLGNITGSTNAPRSGWAINIQ